MARLPKVRGDIDGCYALARHVYKGQKTPEGYNAYMISPDAGDYAYGFSSDVTSSEDRDKVDMVGVLYTVLSEQKATLIELLHAGVSAEICEYLLEVAGSGSLSYLCESGGYIPLFATAGHLLAKLKWTFEHNRDTDSTAKYIKDIFLVIHAIERRFGYRPRRRMGPSFFGNLLFDIGENGVIKIAGKTWEEVKNES